MTTTSLFRWREGTRAKKHVTKRAVDRTCFFCVWLHETSNLLQWSDSGLRNVFHQQLLVYWLTFQVRYILKFLEWPLRSSIHRVRIDTPLAAEIPSVELSRNEHTIRGSIAFAIVPSFQGHSPMAVWQAHLQWHTRIRTPPILLLHHLQEVVKSEGHAPWLRFAPKSGKPRKLEQTPTQCAMVRPTPLVVAFPAPRVRKLPATSVMNTESPLWKPLLTGRAAPQAWPLRWCPRPWLLARLPLWVPGLCDQSLQLICLQQLRSTCLQLLQIQASWHGAKDGRGHLHLERWVDCIWAKPMAQGEHQDRQQVSWHPAASRSMATWSHGCDGAVELHFATFPTLRPQRL